MIAVLASGGINLLPDVTVFPQLVVYLAVFFVLNRWVIQPALKILARRNELTLASEAQSSEKQMKITELQTEVAAALKAARQEVLLAEEEKRKSTEAAARARVEASRKQAQAGIEAERAKLQAEAGQVEQELSKQAASFKQDILQRVTHFEEVAS